MPDLADADLERFVAAQDPVYPQMLGELRRGRKTSHWMWFVFPQLRGLGRSEMARHYGLASAAEAAAYLRHPVLGPRLRECTTLLLDHGSASAAQIFGSPDDLKLQSCLTLFAAVADDAAVFDAALQKFYLGERDLRTLALLAG